jgi:hypothetical protein
LCDKGRKIISIDKPLSWFGWRWKPYQWQRYKFCICGSPVTKVLWGTPTESLPRMFLQKLLWMNSPILRSQAPIWIIRGQHIPGERLGFLQQCPRVEVEGGAVGRPDLVYVTANLNGMKM